MISVGCSRGVHSRALCGQGRRTRLDRGDSGIDIVDSLEKVREVFTYVCAAMGIFSIIFCVYQAANNRIQSALICFLAFALCGTYVFIAQIKAFKVWQIEVQLRDKLNEANSTIEQLRQLAIVSAKAAYLTIGRGTRFSSPNSAEKQKILDEVDTQLKALNISDHQRHQLSSNYIKVVGFDFYMLYVKTLERYFQFRIQDLQSQLNKAPDNTTLKEEVERWRAGRPTFKPNHNLFAQLQSYSLPDEMDRLSTGWLNNTEQKAVTAFRNQILTLYKASEEKGGLTPEAADYYDHYDDLGGQDKKIIELFGFNPSEWR